jgi:hypothetical protein
MTAFKLDTFGGMVPAIDDRLLNTHAAAHSENTWMYSGRISGLPQATLLRANTAGTSKVFRLPTNLVDADHISDSVWLEFQDGDTDVVRALVVGDTYDRYYWASSNATPKYNTRARIAAASAAWTLGIPQPTAPSLVVTGTGAAVTVTSAAPGVFTLNNHGFTFGTQIYLGGTTAPTNLVLGTIYFVTAANLTTNTFTISATLGGVALTTASTGTAVTVDVATANIVRAYVTTWVSTYGEEGPPSPPVVVAGPPNASWGLTIPAAAAGDLGTNRTLAYTNIYRTITSDAGVATYFYVGQVAVATLSYADTKSDITVAAQGELTSTNWSAPPTDLQGFVAMPNGILAGWRENEVWFCEPYRPHAWPAQYTLVTDFPIVGLGVIGQTLVVCTQGYPVTVSGIHPSSMAESRIASLEPCLSRGSILSTTEGVYYASPNGLVFVGAGTLTNLTKQLITKDKWHDLATAATLRAARLGTAYFAFGSTTSGSFDPLSFDPLSFAQTDYAGAYVGVLIDPNDPRVAFNLMSSRSPMTSIMNDPWTGEVFTILDNNLYRINLSDTDAVRQTYIWRSKVFQSGAPVNMGALKVFFAPPGTAPDVSVLSVPGVITTAEFPELPVGSTYGVVRLYGDGILRYTSDLVTSGELHRPPSGYKAEFWQIEIESYLDIYSIQIGTSVKALRQV